MGNRQAEKGDWKGSGGTMTTDNSVCRQLLCCQIIISSSIYHLACNMCKLQETKISPSMAAPKGGPKKRKAAQNAKEKERWRESEREREQKPRSAAGTCGLKLSCI